MIILKIKAEKLRNEEHYQFNTEVNDLVDVYSAPTLGIEVAYATYLPLYSNEGEALDVIRKSAVTDELAEANLVRVDIFRGLRDTIKGATRHFVPKKKEAAERLQIVFDRFGDINTKSYDERTAAITNMVGDLRADYADDLALLKLEDWVDALDTANAAFEALMDERYTGDAAKTQLKMKDVRKEVDDVYRTITERIDALVIVNGAETYTPFIKELNQRIEKYNLIIAQRKGRNNKKDEED